MGLTLATMFGAEAVVQRELPVRVWGWGAKGRVRVRLGAAVGECEASSDGGFVAELPAQPAGGPYELAVADAGGEVRVERVWVGELFLASGQSNMEMMLGPNLPWCKGATGWEAELERAGEEAGIRMMVCPRSFAATPAREIDARWEVPSARNAARFYAVAWFFAKRLWRELGGGVKVGVVCCAAGGSTAEAWVPREVLESHPSLRRIVRDHDLDAAAYPARLTARRAEFDAWKAKADAELAALRIPPACPAGLEDPRTSVYAPALLFNAMLSPFVPGTFRGVLWYQGESNAARWGEAAEVLHAMVSAWRVRLGRRDLPFFTVQLANFGTRDPARADTPWARFREVQERFARETAGVHLTTAIDVGAGNDIHPRNKRAVGERLAGLVLREVFGRSDVVAEGPKVLGWDRRGDGIFVRFDREVVLRGEGGVSVAGADGKWRAGRVKVGVGGCEVEVSGEWRVEAARYAWGDDVECTLFGPEGLPVLPFRTDRG